MRGGGKNPVNSWKLLLPAIYVKQMKNFIAVFYKNKI